MSKHTPGPWYTHYDDNRVMASVVTEDGTSRNRCVAILPIPPRDGPYTDAEQLADEKLILAAPDLLAACEALAAWYRTHQDGDGPKAMDDVFIATRAAIQKATAS